MQSYTRLYRIWVSFKSEIKLLLTLYTVKAENKMLLYRIRNFPSSKGPILDWLLELSKS